jgi:hypothetical protein
MASTAGASPDIALLVTFAIASDRGLWTVGEIGTNAPFKLFIKIKQAIKSVLLFSRHELFG